MQTLDPRKTLSMKMLADVVESLTAASFLHSGYSGAQKCLKIFFPDQAWTEVPTCIAELQDQTPLVEQLGSETLHELVGYTFRNQEPPSRGRDTRTFVGSKA